MTRHGLTLKQAAEYLGRHPKTLQRLDKEGLLKAGRTQTDRRWYAQDDLDVFLGAKVTTKISRRPVAYCRVSSAAQRPDLANQKRVLGDFCAARGLVEVDWIEEVGGGMNFERPKFAALMDRIERREVSHLILAHKDRLVRFGFGWFSRFAKLHGCEVLVLNNESLSPEREMVEDLMTIIHCFSSRLYGLRNYRKSLKKSLDEQAEQTP
jgi:predicted site-specific integrase-resolvase